MGQNFFDVQYSTLEGDRSRSVDHNFYKPLLRFAKTRTEMIERMLGRERFHSVIELGCGKGEIPLRKGELFDQYVGLDISAHQLSRIPENIRKNPKFSFRQYDLNQRADFPDATFDLVLSVSTLEYLFDPISFVREANRILVPGGTFILHTMNVAFFLRRLQLLMGRLPSFNSLPGWQGGNLHDFTFPTLKKLLEDTGFQIAETRCAGLFPSFRMWWPNLLASDMIFRCRKERI